MLQDRNNPNVPLLLAIGLLGALIDSDSGDAPRVATLERVLEDNERSTALLFRTSVPVFGNHPLLLALKSGETGRWCVLPVHEDLDHEQGWDGCALTEPLTVQWAAHGGTATCAEGLAIYGFSERDPMELS